MPEAGAFFIVTLYLAVMCCHLHVVRRRRWKKQGDGGEMTRKFFQCGDNHFGLVDRIPSTLHIGKHYLRCRACGRPMTPEQAGKYLTTRKSVEECMKQALQGATK